MHPLHSYASYIILMLPNYIEKFELFFKKKTPTTLVNCDYIRDVYYILPRRILLKKRIVIAIIFDQNTVTVANYIAVGTDESQNSRFYQ